MDTKTISLRVGQEFDRRLRIEAARRDLNRSEFIRRVLAERISESPRFTPPAIARDVDRSTRSPETQAQNRGV
jgi:hypothetical protein